MNTFLSSLENSCNKFSESANKKREEFNEISNEFKRLDNEVKKQIVFASRPPASRSGITTNYAHSRPRKTTERRVPKKTKEVQLIRPAPYPVKNYILPAQQSIGPARYYNSAKKKQLSIEEEMEAAESNRYPKTMPRPKTASGPDLRVTSSLLYPSISSNQSEIGMYFDKY